MIGIALIGIFWFEVPFHGNPLVLFLGAVLFLMSSVSVGLFISTISSTQQQAQISTFFFTMPAVNLSGFAFPIESMPEWVQILTYANPLRYFLVIIRGVFLKGIGLDILWPQMLALAAPGWDDDPSELAEVPKKIEIEGFGKRVCQKVPKCDICPIKSIAHGSA